MDFGDSKLWENFSFNLNKPQKLKPYLKFLIISVRNTAPEFVIIIIIIVIVNKKFPVYRYIKITIYFLLTLFKQKIAVTYSSLLYVCKTLLQASFFLKRSDCFMH
jgi:hypothetical protein